MTDSFEAWINSMSDEEYEDRLDSSVTSGGFTEAQEQKALNIREPISEENLRDLEAEQESDVVEVDRTRRQPVRVYDTRESPRFITSSSGDAVVTLPNEPSAEQRQRQIEMESRVNPEQAKDIQKRSVIQRLRDFFTRNKLRRIK